jgi:hypothetical protein
LLSTVEDHAPRTIVLPSGEIAADSPRLSLTAPSEAVSVAVATVGVAQPPAGSRNTYAAPSSWL